MMVPNTEDEYNRINDELSRVAPVLSSPFARYPLHRERWLKPFETLSDGRPAFIPTSNFPHSLMNLDTDIPDYVWGYGSLGKGYFHLLTKEAYKNLLDYMNMTELEVTNYMGSIFPGYHKRQQEFEEVKNIVHRRYCLKKPDEVIQPCSKIVEIKECAMSGCNSSMGCTVAQ
mmetsp:Transcript_12363/g.23166  ORF Transcript_12363/g.23166 Transcript_12363/m.23166 type:complete len:172 (+) Transcript_12363:125-640(+)|eukprot:CAMPEP_0176481898 /NCGR_PEP_ID=MMETSP0200_2-20121128/3081_1 /TAXON_ID=947934 /ORGANISM="Chaetoceros sp., Strain GSL56" /LENGTH=171 /DNA_ID=CAMNT_0017878165 /DNA_START=92 /DNA_END=607 /DNA_ORIENTATION=-